MPTEHTHRPRPALARFMRDLVAAVAEPGVYDAVRQMRLLPDGTPAILSSGREKTYTFTEKDADDLASPVLETVLTQEPKSDVADPRGSHMEVTVTKAQKDPGDPTVWGETTLTEAPGRDPSDSAVSAETTNTKAPGIDPGDPTVWAETTITRAPGRDPGDESAGQTSDTVGLRAAWADESYSDDLATGVVSF
jgi:hypothetical protein